MSNGEDENDKVSRWMRALRRNTLIAVVVFACAVLIAAATVTDSASKLASAYHKLFIHSNTPAAQTAVNFRELLKGDPKEIRWLVERLVRDKSVDGFVWGDYQISMTMNVGKSAKTKIAITGLITNIKGPQFSPPDTYELIYDLSPTNTSTQIALSGAGIPGAGMEDMRISEAAYYQEQWDEVRLLIMVDLENIMTKKLKEAAQTIKKK